MAKEESLIVKIAGRLDPSLAAAVNNAGKLIGGAEKATQGIGSAAMKVAGVAATAAAATGAALSAGAGVSIRTAANFDSAMSQVAASMGTTVDQIPDIESMAKKMGAETSFSAVQAAEGFNILAQAGLKADDQIAAIKPVLDLAAAGGIEMGESAAYVTGVVAGFGDSMENASKYADMIALGATQVKTDVGQLGEAFSDAASVSKSFGQTQETTIVTLERLANANVTGSEAAQSMRRVMTRLYAPTGEAAKNLKTLGVSAYDSSGKARDLTEVIADLQSATDKLPDSQKNAYLNTILGQQGLTAFAAITATSTEKTNELYDAMSRASDDGGAAAKQASTMLDNLNGDITIMQSALEGVAIDFGHLLIPEARSAVQWATNALSGVSGILNADMPVEDKITAIAGQVGSIGAEVTTEAANALPQVMSLGGQVIGAFFDGIYENRAQIATAATDTITMLVTSGAEALPDVANFGIDTILAFADGLTDSGNAARIAEAAMNGIAGFINAIYDRRGEILDAGKEIIAQLVQGMMSADSSSFGGVASKIFIGLLALGPVTKILKPIGGIVGAIASPLTRLPGLFTKLGGAAQAATGPAQAASGGLAALSANAKGLLALGGGFLMVAAGMALLSQSAVAIAQGGPMAAVALVVLTGAVAGMAVGAAALAPALAAGAIGLVAFGGGVALIGVGILAATGGLTLLAGQLPTIAASGTQAAVGILAIGTASMVMGAGALVAAAGVAAMILPMVGGTVSIAAFSVALTGLSGATVLLSGSMVVLGGSLTLVATNIESIATNATTAGTAMASMVTGVDVVKTGLDSIKGMAADAVAAVAGAFQGEAPNVSAASTAMATGITTPIRNATTQAVMLFRQMTTAATTSAATIRSAFAGMTITIPRPKLPHINVTYTSVNGGAGGTARIPQFAVQYYAEGGIVNKPTIIGLNGNRPMVAGEKGPEAVTPLSELWKNLRGMASQNQNVTFAPQYVIQGNANRNDMMSASRMSLQEFKELYEKMTRDDRRRSL